MANWEELIREDQLKLIDDLSKERPVLLFKHSTRCSISAMVLDRLHRDWDEEALSQLGISVFVLDLIKYRTISDDIARNYAVSHQSPQVLMIRNGQCVYHASHFEIDRATLENMITRDIKGSVVLP